AKLKSTYVDALPSLVKEDGRLHTSFHQALTATGRLSSSEPNLQNIPIRSVRGARVREAFVAAHGKLLLTADYSQIELRVLAHYSQDPALIEAFQRDQDIHAATASEIFGVSVESVSSDQRRVAKAVNFGIAYGQGAFGLAETLGISRSESQGIIQRYFAKFPGVKSYIEDTIQRATQTLYVETLMGRRRVIKELASQNPAVKKFGERAAINAPIQGTASDIVKKAMIELRDLPGVSLLLQIHDELIFEASPDDLREARPLITEKMEKAFPLRVPLKVNTGMGSNWSSASH
ncbi:MAG: DNA polymerase, partial [Bdellovibrio sp.]